MLQLNHFIEFTFIGRIDNDASFKITTEQPKKYFTQWEWGNVTMNRYDFKLSR